MRLITALFVHSDNAKGSGSNFPATHNVLGNSVDIHGRAGSSGNLTRYNEETGRQERAFYIGTLASAAAGQGSAGNISSSPGLLSRCGRLHVRYTLI